MPASDKPAVPAPQSGGAKDPLGQRQTRTREAIVRVVRDAGAAGRTLCAAQILVEARRIEPGLGHATVYRTLKLLQDCGELSVVAPHHTAARYEIVGPDVRGADAVDRNGELVNGHDRFQCRSCRRAFALQAPKVEAEIDLDATRLGLTSGFIIEECEVTLHGLCPHCIPIPPQNQRFK